MLHSKSRALRCTLVAVGLLGLAGLVVFKTEVFLASLEVGPFGAEADAQLMELKRFYGSPERWREKPEIELCVRGRIPFAPARFAFGLSVEEVDLRLRFRPSVERRYRYVLWDASGPLSGERDTRQDRDDFGLLLDSVRHLFELPLSAASIPYRRSLPAGPAGEHRGFFTWGRHPDATLDYDQIVLWTDAGRLVRMDTTGRDIAPFIVARVGFEGLVDLGSHRLPRRATVYDGSNGDMLHEWEIRSARFVEAGTVAANAPCGGCPEAVIPRGNRPATEANNLRLRLLNRECLGGSCER